MLERLRTSATVTYDINARPAITGTGPDLVARVERVAGLADVVRASDEDLAALWPAHDTSASVQHLLGLGPSAVVVTRGPDGATWTSISGEVTVDSVRVQVADTIAAGDTFGAALIDALWERGHLGGRLGPLSDKVAAEVLEHAVRAAAIAVSRPGRTRRGAANCETTEVSSGCDEWRAAYPATAPSSTSVDVPEPGHGQVLLRMKASSICGSDIRAIYREHLGTGPEAYQGVIAGHEPCGQVVAVGPDCRRLRPDDRVVVYHIAGCGVCEECRSGYMIGCTSPLRAAHGWQRDGGHAEYLLAEEATCILLPEPLSYVDGALVSCGFGTAYEGLLRLELSGRTSC